MSKITNDRLNPVWHRMLYSCIHVATVGIKVIRVDVCYVDTNRPSEACGKTITGW